jgi:hypothetical protein
MANSLCRRDYFAGCGFAWCAAGSVDGINFCARGVVAMQPGLRFRRKVCGRALSALWPRYRGKLRNNITYGSEEVLAEAGATETQIDAAIEKVKPQSNTVVWSVAVFLFSGDCLCPAGSLLRP